MQEQIIYHYSLFASYIAGMVALFAPCCISYLFPAYLGNIFKERKHVLFMTFVYSLGILTVMLPVVLGVKALSTLFFKLHDQTYLIGGLFMIVIAFFSVIGFKLPFPHLSYKNTKKGVGVYSSFSLGIFSGITSSCCAPVLVGVVTLSSLTPSIFQSLFIGIFYVLGMVTPLYLASLFIYKKNILENPLIKRKITSLNFGRKTYTIFVSNLISGLIFVISGLIMIWFTISGKLSMGASQAAISKEITDIAFLVTKTTARFAFVDIVFIGLAAFIGYKFVKLIFKE